MDEAPKNDSPILYNLDGWCFFIRRSLLDADKHWCLRTWRSSGFIVLSLAVLTISFSILSVFLLWSLRPRCCCIWTQAIDVSRSRWITDKACWVYAVDSVFSFIQYSISATAPVSCYCWLLLCLKRVELAAEAFSEKETSDWGSGQQIRPLAGISITFQTGRFSRESCCDYAWQGEFEWGE